MSLPKTFTAGERLFAVDLNDNFVYVAEETEKTAADLNKISFFLMGA